MRFLKQTITRLRNRPRTYRPSLEGLEDRRLMATAAFLQTNLIADQPGVAQKTDPNLVNAWGMAFTSSGPFWFSDNGTGVSTLDDTYTNSGSLVVSIPRPPGDPNPTATPTGIVANETADFTVHSGNLSGTSLFLFATEDGTISGWSPNADETHAILAVDNSAVPNAANGAVYKGLALAANATGNFLYAANFRSGTIDVFDKTFAKATLLGSFADPTLPAGFAPFNIQALGGKLYVTYAKQDAAKAGDVAGPGNGFVDAFSTDGVLLGRLVSNGPLNSPWGLALAPSGFGPFGGALLVGNFGDGRINAFNATTGAFLGTLMSATNTPVRIDGLWGLAFGNGVSAGDPNVLYVTAGPGDEQHGLFAALRPENATERFVGQAYQDLLGRPVDPAGLGHFVAELTQGAPRSAVAVEIEQSLEYRARVVRGVYTQFLHRAADPTGLNAWVGFLGKGGTPEQIEAAVAGSGEYFQNRGKGTIDGYLDAIFQDGLGRAVDAGSRKTLDTAFQHGLTTLQIAGFLFTSDEFRVNFLKSAYQTYLHRAGDQQGLAALLDAMKHGLRSDQVIASMIGSPEYTARL